jgi:hypothetical protein
MKKQLPLLAILLFLTACSSITVQQDFDPKADFSSFKAYAWTPLPANKTNDPRVDNALVESRIISAINSQLASKGFQKSNSASADFLVSYAVAVNRRMGAHVIDNYYAYPTPYYTRGRYGYPWMTPMAQPQVRVYEYDEGTLVVDILDARTKGLVFRGAATATLRENPTPDQSTQRINEAVSKILAKFPPTTSSSGS